MRNPQTYDRLVADFQATLREYGRTVDELIRRARNPTGDLKPLQDLFRQVDELGMKLKDQRSAIAMMLFQDQPL